jgi:hypothetical protein
VGRGAGPVDVVIPSIGRASLDALLLALAAEVDGGGALAPALLVVVDDRAPRRSPPRRPGAPASVGDGRPFVERIPPSLRDRALVVRSGGRGPAAARNAGWRAGRAPWVAFLDDDVVPVPGWLAALHADLAGLDARVGASQGRVEVPLPEHRRPTDHERGVAGLAAARRDYRRPAVDCCGDLLPVRSTSWTSGPTGDAAHLSLDAKRHRY